MFSSSFILGLVSLWGLLDFYVFFWVSCFDEVFADFFAVVALEHYEAVFCGSAASAKTF